MRDSFLKYDPGTVKRGEGGKKIGPHWRENEVNRFSPKLLSKASPSESAGNPSYNPSHVSLIFDNTGTHTRTEQERPYTEQF